MTFHQNRGSGHEAQRDFKGPMERPYKAAQNEQASPKTALWFSGNVGLTNFRKHFS